MSVMNRLYTNDIAPIIEVTNTYLVPHSYMRADALLTEYFYDWDLVEKVGEEYVFYRCFVADTLYDAYDLASYTKTDFVYESKTKSKVPVSYSEGLGDK